VPATGSRKVTISAIAAEAGVSVPTVSRVLNGRSDVAADTRDRVERLLREQGYRRRGTARPGGRDGRAGLIDLVFNDLDSPWAVEVIRGVEEAGHRAGFGTVVAAIHRGADSRRLWLDNIVARSSDGAILVTTVLDPDLHSELERLHVPVVVVDPAGVPDLKVPTIAAGNWAGALSAVEHLTSLGHRRIATITGRPGLWCTRSRLDGYRAGLHAAGLEVDPSLVVEGDFDYASGCRAADGLLTLPDPPTAIFAASDQMALGVYEAARRHGACIPEDLSVVGFDGLPESRWSSPPLTTVRQPLAEMGAVAVRAITRLLAGEPVETPRLELGTELLVRESTRSRAS